MKNTMVACAQQQMRLFDSLDSYRRELDRFLAMARSKGAELVVFPALEGVMAASSLVEGFKIGLLKQADGGRRTGSFWRRTRDAIAGGTANLLGADFRSSYAQLLQRDRESVRASYEAAFGELAAVYGLTVIAGSAYLPHGDSAVRHTATVFGPDGAILGRHSKVILSPDEIDLCEPGETWDVIETPVGRVGILIGEELLYPESGRILAYRGAELIVGLAAVADEGLAAHLRLAAISRSQENQVFALSSFLVGKNQIAPGVDPRLPLVGRSGIYAPLEMTQRHTGVLVEMGTPVSEGLLTAELHRARLHDLWQSAAGPVRVRMPAQLFATLLPELYGAGRTLDEVWTNAGAETAAVIPALTGGATDSAETSAGPELPALPAPPDLLGEDELAAFESGTDQVESATPGAREAHPTTGLSVGSPDFEPDPSEAEADPGANR